jgi:hypothetical protein
MAAYSMDLRASVLTNWDAGMKADDVAAKYRVSRAWVHRLAVPVVHHIQRWLQRLTVSPQFAWVDRVAIVLAASHVFSNTANMVWEFDLGVVVILLLHGKA